MRTERERQGGPAAWGAANATVFVSSACLMVIELVAGRLVAPHLGSSLYTWTSVIGVVLAGIALGNYAGGRLADRFAARSMLATLFIVCSACCTGITVIQEVVGDWPALWTLSWPVRVALHVALVFFAPAAMLGTISPVVAKMALDVGRQKGRTIGSLYAWGVIGSLIGTFLTGFLLIDLLGCRTAVWIVAGVLAAMGLSYGRRLRVAWSWVGVWTGLAVLGNAPTTWAVAAGERLWLRERRDPRVIYADESQYSTIKVFRLSTEPDKRSMVLDKLVHSMVRMDDIGNLEYAYEKTYAAITKRISRERTEVNSLMIGGGGYVYPRWMAANWPGSRMDVVEIDPAVTKAAVAAFGLSGDAPMRRIHQDGRVFLAELVRGRQEGGAAGRYDFVYCDAFNDYAVPHQLTSVEFVQMVGEALAPDGAYLVNLIDVYDQGRMLGAMYNTLRRVFEHVYVFVEGHPVAANRTSRETFILMGSRRPIDTTALGEEYRPGCYIYCLSAAEIDEIVRRSEGLVLTDDHAPVESLLAPVVKLDSTQMAAREYLDRAAEAQARGELDRAARRLEEGLRVLDELAPNRARGYFEYGNAFYNLRMAEQAAAAYEKAVALEAGFDDAMFNLGSAYAAQGKFDRAADCYRELLRRNPQDESVKRHLERVLAAQRGG